MYYVGQILKSKNFGEFEVLGFKTETEVLVRFTYTGFETIVNLAQVESGAIVDRFYPTTFGVGYLGDGDRISANNTRQARIWHGMLTRCYGDDVKYRSYLDCTVSDNFKNLGYFCNWCLKQVGFNEKGFELDKDLLSKGRKIYSEDTCVFIPKEMNLFLASSKSVRGEFVIGVSFDKASQKFKVASTSWCNDRKGYSSEWEAFMVFKKAKEAHAKKLANKYKDKVDPRVYEALMSYKVLLTD